MAERMTREERWSYIERVLVNAQVAEKGKIACIQLSSGNIVAASAAAGLLPIGYFDQTLTGNGTSKVRVKLFKEVILHRFASVAGADDVLDTDTGNTCYLQDGETVTMNATGRSIAGRVWGVTSAGVLVEPAINT